jgi:hypothetical protein
MNLDDELKRAFRREEPSAGFAERVLTERRRVRRTAMMRRFIGWSVAAALLAAGFGLEYRHRAEGEVAKEKSVLALQIAGKQLNLVRARLVRAQSGNGAENE